MAIDEGTDSAKVRIIGLEGGLVGVAARPHRGRAAAAIRRRPRSSRERRTMDSGNLREMIAVEEIQACMQFGRNLFLQSFDRAAAA